MEWFIDRNSSIISTIFYLVFFKICFSELLNSASAEYIYRLMTAILIYRQYYMHVNTLGVGPFSNRHTSPSSPTDVGY